MRKDEIKEAAHREADGMVFEGALYSGFIAGAEWADKHPFTDYEEKISTSCQYHVMLELAEEALHVIASNDENHPDGICAHNALIRIEKLKSGFQPDSQE